MHWILTVHVRRYMRWYNSSGHAWQGRFNAFPIQEDLH
jgi:putative transposase